jgi:crotonobetainyl-CoA:carnitine CoA-transferase CaiB-like acyl-CoA transferase
MALRARDQSGKGQYVDVAMLDGMISTMTSNYMGFLGSGITPRPLGTSFPTVVPYRVFAGRDRSFAIAVGSEKLWSAFCGIIGRPDLESHPDYATNPLRVQHRPELEKILAEIFRYRTAADWLQTLRSVGIPCSLVRNFAEVYEHPQAAFREMFPLIGHPTAGPHRTTGTPVRLSENPGHPTSGAPLLGEHTGDVLMQLLELDAPAVEELAAAGIIFNAVI